VKKPDADYHDLSRPPYPVNDCCACVRWSGHLFGLALSALPNFETAYCDFGENFNCDLVNRSTYSTVFGIPVALVGIMGYIALLALATLRCIKRNTPVISLIASLAGLGFTLYLTYVEGFVLAVWCILCLLSLGLFF
jgi:uncharacterized membrane protein